MSYKDEIFRLYGQNVAENDSYVDADGKGLFERFNELLGQDLDENTVKMVKGLLDNMIVPSTMMERFKPLLLKEVGFTPNLYLSDEGFDRLMSLLQVIYDSRGLQSCYEILFRLIGVKSIIADAKEKYTVQGFDSSEVLDSTRTLDSSSTRTFYFDFYVEGEAELTDQLVESIMGIIAFNTPYYLIYVRVYYNNELIYLNGFTQLYVDEGYVVTDYVEDIIKVNDIYVN